MLDLDNSDKERSGAILFKGLWKTILLFLISSASSASTRADVRAATGWACRYTDGLLVRNHVAIEIVLKPQCRC